MTSFPAPPAYIRYGFLILLGIAIAASGLSFFNGTDVATWRHDWETLARCVAEPACSSLSQFPIAYLLNSGAIALFQGTASPDVVLWIANYLFLLLPIASAIAARLPTLGNRTAIYLAALLCSPVPVYYVHSGALEVQSGVMLGLFIVSLSRFVTSEPTRNCSEKLILPLIAFLLPLYKDTAIAPLVVGGALFVIFLAIFDGTIPTLTRVIRSNSTRLVLFVLVPVILSLAVQGVYNYQRYHSPLPMAYISVAAETSPPLAISGRFLIASILSPNGGVLAFWLLSFVAVVIGIRWAGVRPNRYAVAAAAGQVVVSLFAFSLWWAPFGWDSWGNRLMIPSMLCLLIVVVFTTSPSSVPPERGVPQARKGIEAVAKRRSGISLSGLPARAAAFVVGLFFLTSLAMSANYIAATYLSPSAYFRSLHGTGPKCEKLAVRLRDNPDLSIWRSKLYYACATERFLHVPWFWR